MDIPYRKKGQELLMMEDYQGVPVSIPAEMVGVFQERQKELKRRQEAGEPLMTPEEQKESEELLKFAMEEYRRLSKHPSNLTAEKD